MIDFRYHLISIIAVMLSLALGILVGSGFIGDPLLEDLKDRADSVTRSNDRLRALGDDLRRRIDEHEEFAAAVGPLLLAQRLRGETLILVVHDGTDGGVVAGIEQELELAGAEISGTIRLSDRFRLDTAADRDQLALILRSVLTAPDELRAETGHVLGVRAAASAAAPFRPNELPDVTRFHAVMDELQEAEFVSATFESPDRYVLPGASFVIIGGDTEPPRFPVEEITVALAAALTEGGSAALVAEPGTSVWGLVGAVRGDVSVADTVATVDSAETLPGRLAVVLALAEADRGDPGHYGTKDGASGLIPAEGN